MLPILHGRKAAQAILGGKEAAEGPADEGKEGLHAAAADVLSAIESKDEAALAEALEAFVAQCSGPEGE